MEDFIDLISVKLRQWNDEMSGIKNDNSLKARASVDLVFYRIGYVPDELDAGRFDGSSSPCICRYMP